jgi:hypothetical protein
MFIRLLQTCGLTWLFWLYLSPHLVLWLNGKFFWEGAANSTPQPVQVSLTAINSLAQAVSLPFKPSLSKNQRLQASAINHSDLNRLEISLSRRQVILFLDNVPVKTYPVAIGRSGWETPTGKFKVLDMKEDPTWINPLTDAVIPGGDPKNPLGDYWISFWTDGRNSIGFHGTPNPESVGKAVSHGCVRMHNEDVQQLFYRVSPGTPVIVKR